MIVAMGKEDLFDRVALCINDCYSATTKQRGGSVLETFHEIKKKLADIIPFQNGVPGVCYTGYRGTGRLPARGHIHVSQLEVMASGAFLANTSDAVTFCVLEFAPPITPQNAS